MKLHTRSGSRAALIVFMLMLIPLALPGKVMAVTGSINSCSACHNYPPDDSATRDSATGAFTGNHGTHFSANNCQACHNSVGASEYNHSLKSSVAGLNYINMTGVIHRSRMWAAAKYNKGVKFAQSSTPTLSNCSNVNCHFESATPTWGQASPWSSTKTANNNDANCAQCHASAGLSSGKHTKHITAGGGTLTACSRCHPDYNALAGTAAFAHTTSVGSPITINFSAAPNLGGTYTGGRTGSDFLPSAGVAATGTCSALYCHSPGNKASSYDPPNTTPVTWATSLDCKGCHKAEAFSGAEMSSGSHQAHVNNALAYTAIKCATCHAATATSSMTIADVTMHANKSVDVAFANSSSAANGSYNGSLAKPASPSSKAPGSPVGSCQNIYCHSTGQHSDGTALLVADYQTPVWGTPASGQCGTCHALTGSTAHGGFGGYVKAGPAIASGKHTKHLSYMYGISDNDMRCAICHAYDKTAFATSAASCGTTCHGGSPNNTGAKHANYEINVNIANYVGASASYSGTTKPGDGYGSCSSVYCHSDGQATPAYAPAINWAAAGPLACTACHGSAAVNSPGGTPLSGKHAAHVNPAVNTELGTGNGFGCVECHQITVASNTTLNATTGTTAHVNKFVDYTGLRAGGPTRYNSVTKQCSNFYCHSNAKVGTTVAEFKNPPAWNSASTLGCNGCHGNNTVSPDAANPTNANLGQPNYTNGGAGLANANSHKKHVIDAGLLNTTGCYNCHARTVDKNVASRFRPYSTTHVSGGINIAFSPTIGGTYTPGAGSKTCATTACHGAGTPQWGGASLACNACHSANNSGYWAANSSHRQHWEDAAVLPTSYTAAPGNTGTATTYMFQCSSCHASTASHANLTNAASSFGSAEIFFGYTSANRKGSYNYAGSTAGNEGTIKWTAGGNCSTTYCHSNGNGGNPINTTFTWNSPNGTLDCGGCHDKAGDVGWSGSATHLKHVTSYVANTSITCNACHALTASSSSALSDKTKHVNKTKDVSFNAFANSAATHNLTTSQCQNVYCHGNGTTATPTVTVSWSGSLGCTGCHPTTALSTGSHNKHILASATCNNCHNVTAASNSALNVTTGTANHVNKSVTINLDGVSATAAAQYNGTNAGGANIYQKAVASATGTCSNIYCHNNGTGIWTGTPGTGSTPTWGTAGGCNACHGNATYANYRKAGPTYASASPKPNAHPEHIDITDATADGTGGTGTQCKHCHYTITTNNTTVNGTAALSHAAGSYTVAASGASATYKDGDNVGGANVNVTATYTYNATPNSSTCSNVSCHPTGLGQASKATTVTTWDDKYKCTDCHKIDMNNTTGYHHVMDATAMGNRTYPTAAPGSTATDASRKCTMCHVDHDIFSPKLNSNVADRSNNLRTAIGTTPNATTGYTNSDYVGGSGSTGGICISCHSNELTKNTTAQKNDTTTKTPVVTFVAYSGSAHEYGVNSTMRNGGGTFVSNCTKCHNGRNGETAVFSQMTTNLHDNSRRRNYASLGANLTDGDDADFCYRCHSKLGDTTPGGGPAKTVANRDYYNAIAMNTASQDIFTVFNGVGTSYTTSTSATLYLRDTAAINAIPPAPADPAAYQYSSGTYTTNTFTQRDMAPTSGAITTSTNISTGATAARYNRGLQFVSPQINNTVSIPSGSNFTLTLREARAVGTSTDYTRFTVYKWDGTTATPLNTTVAPNNFGQNATAISTTTTNRSTTFTTNSAVTLNSGDALICDVEFYHSAGTTALNVTYTYGNFGTDAAALVLPAGTYDWRTAATTKPGHAVDNAAYSGKHKPSPTDETLAYISANKHVSCNDCHDPHEARQGNHTFNASQQVQMAKALKGATGVAVTWNAANWTAPTYTASGAALPAATAEYQICFKCHSGANTSYATWGGTGAAAWTDIGLEFSPTNKSSHPVVVSTNDASRTNATAPKALTAARMVAPWAANVGTQTMTCTDCHATNSTASKGPHGSGVKWMLAGTRKAWPYTLASQNGGSTGTLWTYNTAAGSGDDQIFCLNCHVINNSPHTATSDHQGTACVNCHLRVPHGGKVSRLIATRDGNPGTTLPARYHPNGNGGGGTVYITGFKKASGSYGTGNCAVTGCSSHGAITSPEAW